MKRKAKRRESLEPARGPIPVAPLVQDAIESQVRRDPDKIAATFRDQAISYRELDKRSKALANRLRAKGVGRNELVCVFLNRSLEMLVSLLAVHKAGAAYVPLDPSHPRDRLQLMVEDSRARMVLTSRDLVAQLPSAGLQPVIVEASEIQPATGELTAPEKITAPDDLAYVIYTSGSTGKPKGVEIPHGALANFMVSMREEPGIDSTDTILAVTTLSFDIAGLELLLPLTVGAKVIIADQGEVQNGLRLMECLGHATIMQATPATWRLLIEAGWKGDPKLKILCGGEPMQRKLADELLDRCASLWNMYGPTETTVWSTLHRVTREERPVPIGKPIRSTELHILDSAMKPVPNGEIGELYIGGAGLARGYRFRPELTREKFVPNPFGPGRIYKTGDLARCREDGLVECLGRIDHQVKIRGFRIELGEIEQILNNCSSVKTAIVSAVEDPKGDKRLVAYYESVKGESTQVTELRKLAKESLPNYMWPSAYVRLDSFPLTANGKIDRKALPLPDWSRLNVAAGQEPPHTSDLMHTLSRIWADILGLEQVGPDQNYFDIGGDSIKSQRIILAVRKTTGVDLSSVDFRSVSTLSDMVRHILQRTALQPSKVDTLQTPNYATVTTSPPRGDQAEDALTVINRTFESAMNWDLPGPIFMRIAPDCKMHSPIMREWSRGPEAFREFINFYKSLIPDLKFKVEEITTDGRSVFARWHADGIHEGASLGIRPTGRRVSLSGITQAQVAEGKIIELWGNWDYPSLTQQIGSSIDEIRQRWLKRGIPVITRREGPLDGETILLIPPLTSPGPFMYRSEIKALKATHVVGTYELLGTRLALLGQIPFAGYGMQHEVETALASIQEMQLTRPLHVVGWSFGGSLALELAISNPQLVKSLTLIEPDAPWALDPSEIESSDRAFLNKLLQAGIPQADEEALIADLRHCKTLPDGDVKSFPGWSSIALFHRNLDFRRQVYASYVRKIQDLQALDAPVLLVTGNDSAPTFHKTAAALQRHIRNCRIVRLKGNHTPHLGDELPKFLKALVEFISDADARKPKKAA